MRRARVQGCLVQIDEQLARHGEPWLLGAQYIAPYLQRMLARPTVQRAFATEGLQPPLV